MTSISAHAAFFNGIPAARRLFCKFLYAGRLHTKNKTRMKKNLILLNPSSGQNRAMRQKQLLEKTLQKYAVNYEMIITESENHLRKLIRKYLSKFEISNLKSISVAGGDSTFTILVNEMIQAGASIPLGIIPLGSSDDIARELGIRSLDAAISSIAAGNFQKMDVGKISDNRQFSFYFAGQANAGIGVFVNQHVAQINRKSASGQTNFGQSFFNNQTLAGIRGIYRAFKENAIPAEFTLKYNSGAGSRNSITITDHFISLLFSKIRYWSTGRLFLPKAKINDGRIHLLMIRNCGFLKILSIMIKAARGTHIDENITRYVSASRFHLSSKQPFLIQVDGDIIQDKKGYKSFYNVTIESVSKRIQVLTP